MVVAVTKLDAAARQLDEAVRLFFARADILAVHTLAGAAFQILEDVGAKVGVQSQLRHSDRIAPERRKEWFAALTATQNFLKHANRDAHVVHEYREEGTNFLLFEAVELASRVLPKESRERLAYRLWFVFVQPKCFKAEYVSSLRALADETRADPADRDLRRRWLKLGER